MKEVLQRPDCDSACNHGNMPSLFREFGVPGMLKSHGRFLDYQQLDFGFFLFSCSVMSDSVTPWTVAHRLQQTSPRGCSNSCWLSQWCHPIIASSVAHFSPCPQSFPASGSFLTSRLFISGGQSIGASTSASVLPMNIQDWFSLTWTIWISLQSKELSRVFSSTTIWKHHFFGAQLFLWSNSHIRSWLLEKPQFDYMDLCRQRHVFAF